MNEAMVNFNERDLVRWCVEAGFAGVHTELDLDSGPMPAMKRMNLHRWTRRVVGAGSKSSWSIGTVLIRG